MIGLGAAVALVVAVTTGRTDDVRAWLTAVVVVTVASLAATLLSSLRDAAHALDQQRNGAAATTEAQARARCLTDVGRPDLAKALAFTRLVLAEDAHYLPPPSAALACVVNNLLPREPVSREDYDPARHWAIHDGELPPEIRRAVEEGPSSSTRRRYIVHSPSFVLVRPGGALAP